MRTVVVSGVFALLQFAAAAARDVPPLFDGGRSEWKVVVREDSPECIRYAAQEFTNAVARVSGVVLPVVSSDEGVSHAVRIFADDGGWVKERVQYRLEGGHLLLTGNQPRAALHAAYAFLDRELGVRWLWPGEDGAFFPTKTKWVFPAKFGFDHEPPTWFRGFHHCGAWRDRIAFIEWETRNYINIHRHGNGKRDARFGHFSMPSTHNANLNRENQLFAEHPECFSLLKGHRSMANVCFSSDLGAEKVAARIASGIESQLKKAPVDIVSIFPNDTQDYCQCDACKSKGVSDAWFGYYNKLVRILHEKYPRLKFATIAYQGYRDPPNCRIENTAFVEYASHGRCHIHRWDDPDCDMNVRELKRLKAWCARDDVGVGHYAYEFDVISHNRISKPFFSVIGDAAETAALLGLVTQITEIGLNPKTGPDVLSNPGQNRLTLLYYARKMWDPSLTLEAFLDDVCAYMYGPAAKTMKEYFLLMDGSWCALPGTMGLAKDGMDISTRLLRDDKVRVKSAGLLVTAERQVRDADARVRRNVRFEKLLYGQWTAFREMRLGNEASFKLPKADASSKGGVSPATVLKARNGGDGVIKVNGHWTPTQEIVFEFSKANEGSVQIIDTCSERYTFTSRGGRKMQQRISDVGVEDTSWKPEWAAETKNGKLVFRLPMTAFAREPAVGEKWDVRFESGVESYPAPADMTVRLHFLAAPVADRPIIYYAADKTCLRGIPAMCAQGESDGWKLIVCTNATELAANVGKADSYLLHIPDPKAFTPEVAAVIRRHVLDGGTLIARSFRPIPLPEILGDTNVVCRRDGAKSFPSSERHVKYVREGDWCTKPWNVKRPLCNTFSPCYMMVPVSPEGQWVEYASMPWVKDETKMVPFISALKYGKGVVIIVGETLHVSHFWLIDNIRRDLSL